MPDLETPKLQSIASVNPRCPRCGCTSDRVAVGSFKCRVMGCRAVFAAVDPDYSKVPAGDTIQASDKIRTGIIKGVPTPHPRCPKCNGTSDEDAAGYRCRVRGCRHVFSA